MNNTNKLISGDNKGYASYLMEQNFNKGSRPGKVSNASGEGEGKGCCQGMGEDCMKKKYGQNH